ncbi:MAG: sensor histidine kinase [Geminicoccaceae bacterium]
MSSTLPFTDECVPYILHEVKQPLTAVITDAEAASRWLTRDSPDLKEAKEAIERIIGNCCRLAEAVQNVRSFVLSPPVTAKLDLEGTVQTLLNLVSSDLQRHGIAVETELTEPLNSIRGDRGQLERVLANLIANGVEAMSSVQNRQRKLRISSRLDCVGGVVVAVEDCGTGIEPGFTDRVFDRHFTTKSQGRGLGLSMCRSIVEAHGGRMWSMPNLPHGSIFSFSIPNALPGRNA